MIDLFLFVSLCRYLGRLIEADNRVGFLTEEDKREAGRLQVSVVRSIERQGFTVTFDSDGLLLRMKHYDDL